MTKKFVISQQKVISSVLLTLTILGGFAACIAITWPYLGLATWKFVDGAPDTPGFVDALIKLLVGLLPAVPAVLFLGGISAILYTFIIKNSESKIFLRVYGGVLLLIFIVFARDYYMK